MTRTEQAIQRRRMSRRIRETVALRRFTATLTKPTTDATTAEPAEAATR